MGALADLLKGTPRATPKAQGKAQRGAGSDKSPPALRRARWLALCADEWLPLETVHSLSDADLEAAEGLLPYDRRLYLRAVDEGRQMATGRRPEGFISRVWCEGCGAVWLPEGHPDRLQACPWCPHRLAGVEVPARPVRCAECAYFQPYPDNPTAGAGQCRKGCLSRWAIQRHLCKKFAPVTAAGHLPEGVRNAPLATDGLPRIARIARIATGWLPN